MNYTIRFTDNSELYINSKELQDKVNDVFRLSFDSVIKYSSGYVVMPAWNNGILELGIIHGYLFNDYVLSSTIKEDLTLANFVKYGIKLSVDAKFYTNKTLALDSIIYYVKNYVV